MTPAPAARRFNNSSDSQRLASGSSPSQGSSSSKSVTSGSASIASRPTRWRVPRDNVPRVPAILRPLALAIVGADQSASHRLVGTSGGSECSPAK